MNNTTLRIFQKGFNFSQDGPGNRLVYHLQGCNLRCPWCSNPEGLQIGQGTEYTVSSLLDEVKRSRMMFFDGGGVTLTGGEVTMQLNAVKEFLAAVHAQEINTCIETNGISSDLPSLFPHLDLLIMDLKHYDPQIHKASTGLDNSQTIKNITAACNIKIPLALRIPLIGGFNAELSDAHHFVSLLNDLDVKDQITVELLPYHEFGKDKYASLGLPYTMTERARVSKTQSAAFAQVLIHAGFRIIHT